MNLACADFAFPLLPHDHVLTLISMMEFDGVDIGLFEDRSHLRPKAQFADAKGNARALKEKLDARGLAVADVFLQTALDFTVTAVNHPDAGVRAFARDMFVKTLDYAETLGAHHVTVLPGVAFPNETRADSLGRCAQELLWRIDLARERGIVLAVEAHLGSIASTPEEALEMLAATPGLTLSLDYTHFTKLGMEDARISKLLPHASHFHARGAAPGKLQTILKENTIDYPAIVRAFVRLGYAGYFGIEYTWNEWENCNRTDNVSETILLRDLVRETLAGM